MTTINLTPHDLLADPTFPYWARAVVREGLRKDPVKAANIFEVITKAFDFHAHRILDGQAAQETCQTCEQIRAEGGFGPSHMGSTSCRSGSLRSGGTMAHCTCDSCF